MKAYKTILILSLFCFSCEEELTWDTQSQNNDLLVVEALLTNEKMNHLVKLSHTNPESNGVWNPASGAGVAIFDGENVNGLLEFPAGSGLYFTDGNFRALFGKRYQLFVQYDGQTYTASDQSVPGEPFTGEEVYEEAGNDLYTLSFNGGIDPSITRYILSWGQTEYCDFNPPEELCAAKVVYYDLKTVDVNQQFRPEKEKIFFPEQSIIIRKKYSLSEPYRQFLRSMLSETEWRGGNFDVQRGNVFTNLSEGAVGFFAVSTVVTDTTIVQ